MSVARGEPILASDLTRLIRSIDEKLTLLFDNGKSWFMFLAGSGGFPPHQAPAVGAMYVLSPDSERKVIPTIFNVPATQYVHSDFVAANASLVKTGYDANRDAVIVDTQPWVGTGVYGFFSNLDIMRGTWTDPDPETGQTYSNKPLLLRNSRQPERFWRYAVAELIIEHSAGGTYDATFLNKFGFVRVHNLSPTGIAVNLPHGKSLAVPRWSVRTVRRWTKDSGWVGDMNYLWPAISGDPPMWDGVGTPSAVVEPDPYPYGSLGDSQKASPIYRVGRLAEMMQPYQAIDYWPGIYHEAVGVNQPLARSADPRLADWMAHPGRIQILKTFFEGGPPPPTERHEVDYNDSSFATSPPATITDLGISVTLGSRGMLLKSILAGVIGFDLMSRSTNAFSFNIRKIDNNGLESLIWLGSGAAADDIYRKLFSQVATKAVPELFGTPRSWYQGQWINDDARDPAAGHWQLDSTTDLETWIARWQTSGGTTLAAWNLFTTTSVEALTFNNGSDPEFSDSNQNTPNFSRDQRQILLTLHGLSVTFDEVAYLYRQQTSGGTDDDGSPILFDSGNASINGKPLVLGNFIGADPPSWVEPRYASWLFGVPRQVDEGNWLALMTTEAQQWHWSDCIKDPAVTGDVLRHHHLTEEDANGLPDGAHWEYGKGGVETAVPYPFGYYRCWSLAVNRPGTSKPGGNTQVGPHVWRIRDHLKRAEDVLQGKEPPRVWADVRDACQDGFTFDSDIEEIFAMRLPMETPQFNEIEDLVNAIRHIRPCDFSHVRYWGIRQDELHPYRPESQTGADEGAPYSVAPYGCVHVWGQDTAIDDRLSALGVGSVTSTLPGTAALATVPMIEFNFYHNLPHQPIDVTALPETSRPIHWHEHNQTWTHLDALRSAVEAFGFSFVYLRWIEPCELRTVVPATSQAVIIDHRDFSWRPYAVPPDPIDWPLPETFHQAQPREFWVPINRTFVYPFGRQEDNPVTAPLQLDSTESRYVREIDIARVFSAWSYLNWDEGPPAPDPAYRQHEEHFWYWLDMGIEVERYFAPGIGGGGPRSNSTRAKQCLRAIPSTWSENGRLICFPIRLTENETLRYGRGSSYEVETSQFDMNVPTVRPPPKNPVVRPLDDTVLTPPLFGGVPSDPTTGYLWECRAINRIGFWF